MFMYAFSQRSQATTPTIVEAIATTNAQPDVSINNEETIPKTLQPHFLIEREATAS